MPDIALNGLACLHKVLLYFTHVQNTVWLVSPLSSAKQQREMGISSSFVENVVVWH